MRKKNFIKKWTCIMLASVMAAGQAETTVMAAGQAETTVEAVDADVTDSWKPDENKTYQYTWCFYQMAPIADEPEMFQFYKDNFNVEFEVWDIEASQSSELLANRIIGGEIPDRFEVANHSILQK